VSTPASLLAPPSRAHKVAAVVVALVSAWLVDSLMDAATGPRGVADQLFRPEPVEIYYRLVLAALLALLYRSSRLAKRLHLFSAAIDAAADGIQITTLEGRVAYSNRAVRDVYGFSPEELQGTHVNEMNADPGFASRVILPALASEGRWEGELEVKHKDGHVFPIWLAASVVMSRGRPIAALGVIRDVSQRRRAEQELRSYARRLEEATELKDLFADILRHDLLGPAATVQLSLDSLARRAPEPELARKMLGNAQRSCRKLIAMIEGAAKYAKLSGAAQIDFGRLDLAQVLREVVAESELQAQGLETRIVLDAPGEYPVQANPMIADVFENLVSNAVKYGPRDGEIRIFVKDEGERWRVCVADRGEGIADEDKRKLFTRFERLRKESVKGTGLGLAIARRIVDLHGGSIWAEDNPGGGALFCVSLRKAPPEP
jgi:PAS domain S-box-containing protein